MNRLELWLLLAVTLTALVLPGCLDGEAGNEPVCTAQEKQCDGNDVQMCSGDGSSWEFYKSCPGGCEAGECKGACTPACTDKQCGDDGCGGECGTCGAGTTCVNSTCQPAGTCTPEQIGCDTNGDVAKCNADGKGWTVVEVCPDGCNLGECVNMEGCTPGETQCSANGDVERCDTNGAGWDTIEVCLQGCNLGQCVGDKSGPCFLGESAGFTHVRIQDNPSNSSVLDCGENPGSDIDAVCLYGPDGEEKACAGVAQYDPTLAGECWNDSSDPNEALGYPDGISSDGMHFGFVSLNGGALVVSFEGGEEILCGDVVHVFAMYNPANPGASFDQYKVSMGDSFFGPWTIESAWIAGESDVEASWEW